MSSSVKPIRLRLRATAESIVRSGHPWIFAESIKEQNRKGAAGELAVAFDRNDKFLAVGLYDPDSPIRVRVLHTGKPIQIDAAWWRARFDEALAKRRDLFDAHTTGYRCINGENDRFPGLVLDRYGDTFVIKIYTAAWLQRVHEFTPLVQSLPNCKRIVLRQSRNLNDETKILHEPDPKYVVPPLGGSGNRPPSPFHPNRLKAELPTQEGVVEFLENGLRFEADVLRGQKTGFFLDQRDNRKFVGELARGRDVLNAFSFSGGFSLSARHGGANSVTDLDISAHALASARRNFMLNDLEDIRHQTIQADTFEFLEQKPSRQFSLIILDPPSLAKRAAEKPGALRAYRQLAESALPWLSKDGILVAASCSAHVTPEEFFGALESFAHKNRFRELRRTENPPDHPATFPEARYLKCIFLARSSIARQPEKQIAARGRNANRRDAIGDRRRIEIDTPTPG